MNWGLILKGINFLIAVVGLFNGITTAIDKYLHIKADQAEKMKGRNMNITDLLLLNISPVDQAVLVKIKTFITSKEAESRIVQGFNSGTLDSMSIGIICEKEPNLIRNPIWLTNIALVNGGVSWEEFQYNLNLRKQDHGHRNSVENLLEGVETSKD